MISDIFISRPRLAAVISIVLTLAGLIALGALPVAQYPDIVPPQVTVSATYPGAGADVVETTVGAADREPRRRRRGHALHEVDERCRRLLPR